MALTPLQRLQNIEAPRQFESDVTSERVAAEQVNVANALEAIKRANAQRELEPIQQPVEPTTEAPSYDFNTTVAGESARTGNIPVVTQAFGNRSSVEAFSKGVNLGTDFGVKKGTPLALPPGEWEVMTTFSGAKEGNRGANSGSGNLVKVVNTKTGEMLTFEHLSGVGVRPGQRLNGGTVVGLSGNTGNSTGDHASIPYQDASGKYHDVLSSPYAKYIFGQVSGSTTGKGGGMAGIGSKAMEALKLLSSLIPKTLPINEQIAQINSLTPEQMNEQAYNLVTAGTVKPLYAKKGVDVLPELQAEMSKNLMKYRRVIKPFGGPMEEAMTKNLNQYQPLLKQIPRLLENGISKFK